MTVDVGLIVGSGFGELPLSIVARSPAKTPYGSPSSPIFTVDIGGERIYCLARHGETHAIPPHEINYRANVWALHAHGVRRCVALNTVGGIAPGLRPGELAVPDQLIDYTWGRAGTFGGSGNQVVHVDFTEPFDPELRGRIADAIDRAGFTVQRGVYGVTQGPRLETAAEIQRLARDGCAMVGMTALPEAALARELDVRYAICALAVNHAAGRAPGGETIPAQVEKVLDAGLQRLARVLERLIPDLCRGAL
jgi:5'-deoxy-5'-methylthioadenosine phosphorylase